MSIRNSAYFVTAVRQLANLETDPIVTDPEIQDRVNEGISALYDIMVGTYEHYAVKTFDFSLAGGLTGSSVALPTDFYKDVSLDRDPTGYPQTVHRYSSWVDRNGLARREYIVMGSSVVVGPPQMASGSYRLSYTPLVDRLFEPAIAVTVTPRTFTLAIGDSSANDSVNPPLSVFFFANGAFTASDIGAPITVSGFVDSSCNGTFTIVDVVDSGTIQVQQVLANETLAAPGSATVTTSDTVTAADSRQIIFRTGDSCASDSVDPPLSAFLLASGDFTASDVGRQIIVTAFSNPSNNGTFTISDVVDATNIQVQRVLTNETLTMGPAPVFLYVTDTTGTATWRFANGAFDSSFVGATLTVSGFAGVPFAADNGVFTVSAVNSPTSITTKAGPLYVSEHLTGANTVTCQPLGTMGALSQMYLPWYEFIQVHAAISVKDKVEQDTSDLEIRLDRLTKRITSMAANRMEEGGQIALPGGYGRGGFWDEVFPFGS